MCRGVPFENGTYLDPTIVPHRLSLVKNVSFLRILDDRDPASHCSLAFGEKPDLAPLSFGPSGDLNALWRECPTPLSSRVPGKRSACTLIFGPYRGGMICSLIFGLHGMLFPSLSRLAENRVPVPVFNI